MIGRPGFVKVLNSHENRRESVDKFQLRFDENSFAEYSSA